jgi:hypothetical protein
MLMSCLIMLAGIGMFVAGFRRELAGLPALGALVFLIGAFIAVGIIDRKYK